MTRSIAFVRIGALRFLAYCLGLIIVVAPAHADDIGAAARGVVRVVTIAAVDGEVAGFGHGSGFAVAPNRIVTNAHVVEAAARYPDNVLIGIVPSAGNKSVQGRLIAIDPNRDLALIEFDDVKLPPLTLYAGPSEDGETVVALGYPGSVDVATARSMSDFIRPLSPVRSQGVFSGQRSLSDVQVLLHTANIARGNSGGPLLDRCGRVIGVNSALTHGEEGDASFGFAIADAELAAFLREAKQPVQTVGTPCSEIAASLAADSAATADARAQAEAKARAEEARLRDAQANAVIAARAANQVTRENVMGVATLLLVLGAMGVGGGALLQTRGDRRAKRVAIGGGVTMVVAVIVFFLRPGFDAEAVKLPMPKPAAVAAAAAGKLACTIDPARSRVTVSAAPPVVLDYSGDGCVNGRTQYAEDGKGGWRRILVPDDEATVSVLSFNPAAQSYTNTRYLLTDAQMTEARQLRKGVTLKACSTDPSARANLAGQQSSIEAALPRQWNERLVYSCKPSP